MPASPGQGTRRYMKLRAIFLDGCKEANAPCWLCGQPIDYRIPHNDPVTGAVNREAFELDHAYPRSTHPELAEDPSNFRRLIERATSSAQMVRATCQWVLFRLGSLLHQMNPILMSSTKRIILVFQNYYYFYPSESLGISE